MGALLNDGRDRSDASDGALAPPPHTLSLFHNHPHLREFVCGGTAAAINIVVTFPPNKIMFRQQVRLFL